MRIKKWEKWYWGIGSVIWVGVAILIFMQKEGVKGTKNGKPHVFSRGDVAQRVLPMVFVFLLWLWFVLRFFSWKLMISFVNTVKKNMVVVLRPKKTFVKLVMTKENIRNN